MRPRRVAAATRITVLLAIVLGTVTASAQKSSSIQVSDLKRWLTYLSSDALEGRASLSEGIGLAAAYLADQMQALGVKPAGDHGTFYQQVKVLGVRTTSRSSVRVEVNGQARVFTDGEAIAFAKNAGGKQTLTFDTVDFLGYGLNAPPIQQDDYKGRDVAGHLVVWLGPAGPKIPETQVGAMRRLLRGRNGFATDVAKAGAVIGPEAPRPGSGGAQGPARPPSGGPAAPAVPIDFTTVQRLDSPVPPAVTVKADGGDAFWAFLFSAADVSYADLKLKADAQEALPAFALAGVKITISVDMTYDVVQTQFTRNVVGVIEGADPKLRNTSLVYGAHYDHTGYRQGPPSGRGAQPGAGAARPPAPGAPVDIINNGADDDGSGCVALLAIAKAFQAGPKPKRSIRFVFFTGEERGLWGSRYDADFGVDPATTVAELNADMISRNRDDKPAEGDTVYLIGSDRISTELHNLTVDSNASMPRPLKLDYEFNDPADPNSFYTRSDHYSYAAKGIPIVFFTTGVHPDYHQVSDSIDKTLFDKLARITELMLETGRRVANLDHAPARDNKGPRVGKGSTGRIGG